MKLYLLRRTDFDFDYDTYDKCVVCAKNKEDAMLITPNNTIIRRSAWSTKEWVNSIDDIEVTELGTANKQTKRGLILASFNAG